MTTLYISGPMRGIEAFNFPAFMEAEKILRANGYETFNPAVKDINDGFDPVALLLKGDEDFATLDFDIRKALAWDCKAVLSSDGIVMLPGWENSKGAKAEYALARAAGIPAWTYHIDDDQQLVLVLFTREVRV